jgi:hypothetical protein
LIFAAQVVVQSLLFGGNGVDFRRKSAGAESLFLGRAVVEKKHSISIALDMADTAIRKLEWLY